MGKPATRALEMMLKFTLQENLPVALELVMVETSGNGGIRYGIGWMHMMVGWVLVMHNFISRSLVHENTNPTGESTERCGSSD